MAIRYGNQTPTFERIGSWASSRGQQAVEMFESYGRRYYGAQKHEFEVLLARDESGDFASLSNGITRPRQNGKSYAVRDYGIWMAVVEGKSVLYSAHDGRTSRKMFMAMCDFVESHEDFQRELKAIYRAAGFEGIYFLNGACIEFQTRTNKGGRGGTYSVIVFDEAQELTAAQQDAILPTVSAAGEVEDGESDPQIIYLGTVPGPGCSGTVFRDMHDKAHSGESGVWWLEWGVQAETLDDIAADDIDLWYACNPAMGRRISERIVRNEHDTMTPAGFARERLGWWAPTSVTIEPVISPGVWDELSVNSAPDSGRTAYGVKFALDGSEVVLVAARASEGAVFLQVLKREVTAAGVGWLVDWLKERVNRACCVVIDGKAGAGNLVERLEGMPIGYVVQPGAADVTTAAAALVDAVNERRVSWYEKQADFRDSAVTSTRRKIGNQGGWGFQGDNPLPIEAASLAFWGLQTCKRDPERRMRIG